MIARISFSLLLLLFCLSLKAQLPDLPTRYRTEFGIDILPLIIRAGGGEINYSELELVYRELQKSGDLRFRLSINNRNFTGSNFVSAEEIEDNQPESLTYVENLYAPKTGFLAGIGISRNMRNNVLPLYYGLDLGFGLARADVNSFYKTIKLTGTDRDLITTNESTLHIIGFSPFLGGRKALGRNIGFFVEFAVPVHFLIGEVPYLDADLKLKEKRFREFELPWSRVISDIGVYISL